MTACEPPARTGPAGARDPRHGWGDFWLHELRLAEWLRIIGATPVQLLVPVGLAAAVAALEGVSLGLLVPIAVGVTKHDFGFVRDMPVFSFVTDRLPGWFGPGGDPFAPLFVLVAFAAFCAALVKNVLSYGAHLLSSYWYGGYLRRANDYVFARAMSFGKLYFDRTNQGTLQVVLSYTGELIDLLSFAQRAVLNLLTLAAYLVVMLWISWRLTLFVLCFFPLTHYLVQRMARRIEHLSRQLNEATLTRHATGFNILSCIPLFKAYAQEAQALQTYAENNEMLRRLNLRINAVQGLLAPFQEVITLTAVLGMISFLAFYLAARAPSELAVFLVFFFAVRAALPKFTSLYDIRMTLAAKKPRLADLATLLEDEGKFVVHEGSVEVGGLREGIEIRNLRFGYRDAVPVLDGISVVFRKGTVTALVGPSGAGKSTLIHLLMGFYPVPAGAIYVDGHDLTTIRASSLRRQMALVAQEIYVFNDTLRANIAVGADRAVDDGEIWDALRAARLADFVRALPSGLDTRVGDRGVSLSGGERQRVAICRAFLKRPQLLILDEATSALDSETERLVQDALVELMRDRTAIVIAHRLSTIRHADQIVLLENGRVVEQGSLAALLACNGRFAAFWRAQHLPLAPGLGRDDQAVR